MKEFVRLNTRPLMLLLFGTSVGAACGAAVLGFFVTLAVVALLTLMSGGRTQ